MVRFINKLTGAEMWVADDRKEEYRAAGHRLAAPPDRSVRPAAAPKKPVKKDKKQR